MRSFMYLEPCIERKVAAEKEKIAERNVKWIETKKESSKLLKLKRREN